MEPTDKAAYEWAEDAAASQRRAGIDFGYSGTWPPLSRTYAPGEDAAAVPIQAAAESWAAPDPDALDLWPLVSRLGDHHIVEPSGAAPANHNAVEVTCPNCRHDLLVVWKVKESLDVMARLDMIWAEIQRAFRLLGVEVDSQHATETTTAEGRGEHGQAAAGDEPAG